MFKAKKSLGQNFLINPGILDKIIAAAELDKNDTVIEIGPGTGVLTKKLAEQAGRIIAVEKDRRLIEGLKEKFKNASVEIIEGDILKLDVGELIENSPYKAVGNIPYYITSHLIKTIFEKWPAPEIIILTVQKEVAQRITAKPPRMNLLALSVQFYAEPKIVSFVSRGSFRPMPKVDSAIIKLAPLRQSRVGDHESKDKFFKLIKTAFAGKRKQLKNTIGLEILNKAGIKP
ncbi:MAG: 16S rRNA (adenine(1518)-N(6)/adenine(1519)-N(6))-dimethyltransferase RsmA, partial [Patescibacteria group bacterium]